jgi:hypothetical protein
MEETESNIIYPLFNIFFLTDETLSKVIHFHDYRFLLTMIKLKMNRFLIRIIEL